jgi:glutamate formiminotransferase
MLVVVHIDMRDWARNIGNHTQHARSGIGIIGCRVKLSIAPKGKDTADRHDQE